MPTDEEIYTAYQAEQQALRAYHEARPGTKKKKALYQEFLRRTGVLMDLLEDERRRLEGVLARLLKQKGKKGVKR